MNAAVLYYNSYGDSPIFYPTNISPRMVTGSMQNNNLTQYFMCINLHNVPKKLHTAHLQENILLRCMMDLFPF